MQVGVLIDCDHDAPALFVTFPVGEGVAEFLGVIEREIEPPSPLTAVSQVQVSAELKMGSLRVGSPVGDIGKAVGCWVAVSGPGVQGKRITEHHAATVDR